MARNDRITTGAMIAALFGFDAVGFGVARAVRTTSVVVERVVNVVVVVIVAVVVELTEPWARLCSNVTAGMCDDG